MLTTLASAQTMQEVVYLKNGSIIKGVIIEQIPNTSLKIQTADGSIFAYKMSEVEKITKENNMSLRNYNNRNNRSGGILFNGKGLQAGYRGFADLGYIVGTGNYGEGRVEFTTSHGYQFCPYIFAGIGVGVSYFHNSLALGVPVFAHLRSEFLNHSITPFLDVKVGYSFVDTKGVYFTPTVGCRLALNNKLGLSAGIGYSMQKANYIYYSFDYYAEYRFNCGGFSIKFGIDF